MIIEEQYVKETLRLWPKLVPFTREADCIEWLQQYIYGQKLIIKTQDEKIEKLRNQNVRFIRDKKYIKKEVGVYCEKRKNRGS